jgi:SAM-dependent methyltransferase
MASPERRGPEQGPRRALTHVGGAVAFEGDATFRPILERALDVPSSAEAEDVARAHVHGFHSYPARLHPITAARLCEDLGARGDRVLDPFCGSGTVLVEARLAGRAAVGVDANPLAVRLAMLKARGVAEPKRAALLAGAEAVAAVAEERRKARAGATKRYGDKDVALFDPHVLLELDGLRAGLDGLESGVTRGDLELVLSAILTKVSRRVADSADHGAPKRIAAGYPTRLFVKKTEELVRRLAEVAPVLCEAPPLRVFLGDARLLRGVSAESVDLVVTSPPYPGVYDYFRHHEARLRWLRLVDLDLERDEIGARRHLAELEAAGALARYRSDMAAVLAAVARTLRPHALTVWLVADGALADTPVFADELFHALAGPAGLAVRAVASQVRPHFHGPTQRVFRHRPRREHAILLAPAPRAPRAEARHEPKRALTKGRG